MKKLALILVAILLLSIVSPFAAADVIIEPEDDFYEAHADECVRLNRCYYSNWNLNIVKSPESDKVQATLNPGDIVRAAYTYTDKNGEIWGLSDYVYEGWFKLSETTLVYDHQAFTEEYAASIQNYSGETPTFADDKVLYYTYPNSGDYFEGTAAADASFSYSYTDEDGKVWLYTPYYRLQDGWVCVEEPVNDGLDSMKKEFVPPTEPAPAPAKTCCDTTWIWIVCIVGAVVVVTVVLLLVFFGKRKKAS